MRDLSWSREVVGSPRASCPGWPPWESPEFAKERLGLDAPLGPIDRAKLNVNGSSLAAGHPFAATGGRIVANLAKLLHQKGSGRGLISICAAGGQGVTAILEK